MPGCGAKGLGFAKSDRARARCVQDLILSRWAASVLGGSSGLKAICECSTTELEELLSDIQTLQMLGLWVRGGDRSDIPNKVLVLSIANLLVLALTFLFVLRPRPQYWAHRQFHSYLAAVA